MAVLIAILGVSSIVTMPIDIFPYIDIPVVSVVWGYSGLSPEEMEKRIVTVFERAMTTTVNDIEHIESQSYNGVSVIRVYFQPNAKVEMAVAQVTAICQTLLRHFSAGNYSAQHHQVRRLQRADPANRPREQDPERAGDLRSRPELHPHPAGHHQGASVPLPYGGKFRQVMVDLDPDALYAKRLSPADVSNALATCKT